MKPLLEIAIEKIPDSFDPDEILPARAGHLVNLERRGFIAGAQWRINSVWHPTADKPDFMRQCLLYLRDPMREGWHIGRVENQGTNKGKWNIYGYFTPALHKYVARWAYIEDLLPADSK